MKTYLHLIFTVLFTVLLQFAAMAQNMIEPTINSTLDNIEIIKLDTDQVFDLFVTAGDRGGEPVQIRMVLDDPAQRDLITLAYNYDPTTPNFVEAEFDEEGMAILGEADDFMDLEDMRVFVRIRMSELGTYGYTFELYRGDLNVIASVSEEVTVAETVPASIRSTLHQNPNIVKGTDTDFYIELKQGEVEDDTPVRVRMTLADPTQADRMTVQVQQGQNYVPLTFDAFGFVEFGSESDLVLTDQRINLRANFADAALYNYKLELRNANTGAVLATRDETAAVNNVAGLPEQIGDERIRVFPTLATNGYVMLELGNVGQAQVQVLDALGRKVMAVDGVSGSNRLSTYGMAQGLYFIKVIKGDEVAGGRFIVR